MHPATNKKLANFYLLSGDETLLVQQARDQISQQAHAAGYRERKILSIESTNDWLSLRDMTQNLGLFDEKQLIDIRHASAKFDKSVQQLLLEYVSDPNPDSIVILSCSKLTSAQKKAKWFTALEPHIRAHFIWPLQPRELGQWIQTRFKQNKLDADRPAIKLLIELTEGNLLATDQAIQKLAMLYPNQTICVEQIAQVIHDSAQFNVFDLANYALAGNTARSLHAIDTIEATGGEAVLVLWALSRVVRELYSLVYQYQRGSSLSQLIAKQWASRKTLLQQAITRLSLDTLKQSLHLCHQTDLIIKGVETGNPWQNLKTIATTLTGATT
jgi:DNA polymerase-3 subunit delta